MRPRLNRTTSVACRTTPRSPNDMKRPPYLSRLRVVTERLPSESSFPFSLPFVGQLDLTFTAPVTFFVGENGSGKSTLLEAIAALNRLPVSGGARSDLGARHGPDTDSALSFALRPAFTRRAPDGYFLRSEFHAHFASLLDQRSDDPWFRMTGDPYEHYGGGSLHRRSHGEAFLSVVLNRFQRGIFLLDEPESALSPQRQLSLLLQMRTLARAGTAQFVIATHSPILLTYPGAQIVSFDQPSLPTVSLHETSHYQLTRQVLQDPEGFWRHLLVGGIQ
ncbi:MAG: AAA family ATPase [Myxococcales bacterium]|nr:AAA family ATPase [Myxococcales bacterium]